VRFTEFFTHVVGMPWRNLTHVQVHTDEGLTGIGEARMLGHTDALLGYLAEAGRDHVAGPVFTAANLHFAACTPNLTIQEHFNDFADAAIKRVAPGLPEVVDGYFTLPRSPGLGVELDVEACAEFPRQRAKFDLFAEDWHLRDPEHAGARAEGRP
jgi:galactonate dehydratase